MTNSNFLREFESGFQILDKKPNVLSAFHLLIGLAVVDATLFACITTAGVVVAG